MGVVKALKFSEFSFPCCRLPSLAPQECSVEPDKGKVRDLVCVGCSNGDREAFSLRLALGGAADFLGQLWLRACPGAGTVCGGTVLWR